MGSGLALPDFRAFSLSFHLPGMHTAQGYGVLTGTSVASVLNQENRCSEWTSSRLQVES
jgi:hypothetical protein